jgi:hypothetical protein
MSHAFPDTTAAPPLLSPNAWAEYRKTLAPVLVHSGVLLLDATGSKKVYCLSLTCVFPGLCRLPTRKNAILPPHPLALEEHCTYKPGLRNRMHKMFRLEHLEEKLLRRYSAARV